MARPQLTGAGTQLVQLLDDASTHLQRLHGIVEKMAMAAKAQQSTAPFGQQLRRAAGPLVGLLKTRYAMLADQVTSMILIATRGGNEQRKVSALRETVGQLRAQFEIAMNKVYEHHAITMDRETT
ncbi:MAG: hypothetical protein ACT4PJ_13605 [Gemmatimonadaceae bacterium]